MSTATTETIVKQMSLNSSDNFEPEFKLETFDRATVILDDALNALKYNGGIKIKGFLNPDEVQKFEAIATEVLKTTELQNPSDTTKRLTRLAISIPDLMTKILTDELYLGINDALLTTKHSAWFDGEKLDFENKPVVSTTTAFDVAPGTGVQTLHRDDILWFNKFDKIKPEEYQVGRDVCISFFIAGRDTTAANGATRWIPGSHLGNYLDEADPSKAIPAELNAGDAFFMLSSCYHGAGWNQTKDQHRLVYALFMMQSHLRQEENIYLSLPLDVVKALPVPVQERLGYSWTSNLGWVDYKSPMEAILGHEAQPHSFNVSYNTPADA
ncbi:putative phytanoyl-dioxygenase family protein-2 [Coleophoma cylindrospora]|uniref:Putative phytanoyl-dioxygenase family protein-2 n=1 Tax=Coleophoma cylindrospora TaxID=1849047 RepID=A0A3D8SNW1_9HELO|nr:putative phytanoyl-dioxygenase family protein-2 [Coleophoma cylindrospora]